VDPEQARIIQQVFGIAGRASSLERASFGVSDTEFWPSTAIDSLISARLIKVAGQSNEIECHGCEERCLRPIEVIERGVGKPEQFVSTCDLFEGLGPFIHKKDELRTWTTSRRMISEFFQRQLKLQLAEYDELWRRVRFRPIEGKMVRRSVSLEFGAHPTVCIGTLKIDLSSLISWDDESIQIDDHYFFECFLASEQHQSGNKPYQASRTVQADNKLATDIRDRRLQREIDRLARKHPRLNKDQLAEKLVRQNEFSDLSAGRVLRIVRMPTGHRKK
jgi:hypothetical protein